MAFPFFRSSTPSFALACARGSRGYEEEQFSNGRFGVGKRRRILLGGLEQVVGVPQQSQE
jgi:hypothetical protein